MGKPLEDIPKLWDPAPAWETHKRFLAPGFRLAQHKPLRSLGDWIIGWKIFLFVFPPLCISDLVIKINKSWKKKKEPRTHLGKKKINKKYFIDFYCKVRNRDRSRDRDKVLPSNDSLPWPSGHNGWSWANQKPASWRFFRICNNAPWSLGFVLSPTAFQALKQGAGWEAWLPG